jgi:XTP/dITP diphosphohydrolase
MRFNRSMIKLLIATRNDHKVGEIQTMLGAGFQCLTLRDFPDAPAVVEDAPTFAGNANKKATEIAHWLRGQVGQRPDYVLADDSGLEVDALAGAPGIHSARFAALDSRRSGNSSDAENNSKLLALLKEVPVAQRKARFRCVVAVVAVAQGREHTTWLFEGTCPGRVDYAARGTGGFGYDPLFIPDGFAVSFAELGETVKNRISHRAKALAKLKAALA